MSNRPSDYVGRARPNRNVFDLSFRVATTCDMGDLVPVGMLECVPGDTFKLSAEMVIRLQPPAAPLYHDVYASIHYFYVPYRILDRQTQSPGIYPAGPDYPIEPSNVGISVPSLFERFIVQAVGPDGPSVALQTFPPRNLIGSDGWVNIGTGTTPSFIVQQEYFGRYSLWDYFGFPSLNDTPMSMLGTRPINGNDRQGWATVGTRDIQNDPLAYPWMAYNVIYNEYYRDQDLQQIIDVFNPRVLKRNWRKDYFTSARPFRTKGFNPAMPVSPLTQYTPIGAVSPTGTFNQGAFTVVPPVGAVPTFLSVGIPAPPMPPLTMGVAQSPSYSGFDAAMLRQLVQTTKFLERNARAGTRYTEFLSAHFSVSPSDARLDRPEYIGGVRVPIIINEVLQTSGTTNDNVLGELGARALAANRGYVGKYYVQEFGIIQALLSIVPTPTYQSDGIHRSWSRRLPSDFYFPEFAHLSEQAIRQKELTFDFLGTQLTGNNNIFGFCGAYDELRVMHDMTTADFRLGSPGNPQYSAVGGYGTNNQGSIPLLEAPHLNLSYWTLSRKLVQVDNPFVGPDLQSNNLPNLNSNFVTCIPRKDVFLVQGTPHLPVKSCLVNIQHNIRATRPLPLIAEPGLLDHF